jgi:hypothetical protein
MFKGVVMSKKHNKPAWWVLYILVVVMIGALIAESRDGLPSWANEIGGIGILLIFFALVVIWLSVNASALWEEESELAKRENYRIREYDPEPWPREEDTKDGDEPSYILDVASRRDDPWESM